MEQHRLLYLVVLLLLCFASISCSHFKTEADVEDRVKIALQAVGHDVVQAQRDSTSLLVPVVETEASMSRLQFEKEVVIDLAILHKSIHTNFEKATLPEPFLVELKPCGEERVVYSYQTNSQKEKIIIPSESFLPKGCYIIDLKIIKNNKSRVLFYALVTLVILFILFVFASRFFTTEMHDHD